MEADKVIVELIARTEKLERDVKKAAGDFDTAMKRIEDSANRGERSLNNALNKAGQANTRFAQSMKRDYADISGLLQSPASPFLLPQKQAPAAAMALKGLAMASSALGGVLGGVVALGASAAAGALADLLIKAFDTTSEVDKMVAKLREQAQQSRDSAKAAEIFGNSIEGVTVALDDNEKALRSLRNAEQTSAEQALINAQAQRQKALAIRQVTVALLEQVKAEYLSSRQLNFGAAGGAGAGNAQAIYAGRVQEVEGLLKNANTQLQRAEKQVTEALSFASVEKAGRSALEAIDARYDKLVENARKAAVASGKVGAALDAELKRLNKLRDAEKEREREKDRAANKKPKADKGPSLAPVTAAEVAGALGLSAGQYGGTRSAARNKQVGGAANSYHLTGQAIDIPLTVNGKPMTKAGIRAALAPLGVEIKELLGPGDPKHDDHFHIAFGKKRLTPDQVASRGERDASRAEREAERLAEEARRNEERYLADLENLNGRILQLKEKGATDLETQLALQLAQIESDRLAADRAVRRRQEEGELDGVRAKELMLKNQEIADLEAAAARRAANAEQQRRAEEAAKKALDYQVQDLEYAAEMATSRAQSLDLQLQIIDLVFDQRIKQLELNKALAYYTGNVQQAADIQAEINRAQIEKGQAQGRAKAQNASPLEAAAQDATNISDELEGLALNSVNAFSDAIAGAITGTKDLKQAFGDMARSIIADLVQMIVKALIFKALQAAFGLGFSQGGPVGGPVKAATGGRVVGPGTGTSDSIPAMLSNGEFVIRRRVVDKLGAGALHYINQTGQLPRRYAAGGEVGRRIQPSNGRALASNAYGTRNGPSGPPMVFDLRGAVVTEDLLRQMNVIASTRAADAGRAAFDASQRRAPQRIDQLQRLGT